jgi:hypothetical protein
MPTSFACIRLGSASITSIRLACSPAPTSFSPISPRGRSRFVSRPRSRCCRFIIRSASLSNGRRSIYSATVASILPRAVATTDANTNPSTSRSRTIRRSSRRGWSWCESFGRPTTASRIMANTIRSRTCASPQDLCSARFPLTSPRSPSLRSNSRRGSAAD